MLWYSEKKPDYIILETGLGGRLDATNVIEYPALCIITRIGLDHTEILGHTIPEIAAEKAGIIKPGVPVIYLAQPEEAGKVISEKAKLSGSREYPVPVNKSLDFSPYFHYDNHTRFTLPHCALYQRENLPLALAAAEYLTGKTDTEAFQRGLENFHWMSRFEEIAPGVIIDGAHNPDGIRAFLESVKADGLEKGRILIFAMLKGKGYEEACRMITKADLFSLIIVTGINSARALEPEVIAQCFKARGATQVKVIGEAGKALAFARNQENNRIYIAGSLYLRSAMEGQK